MQTVAIAGVGLIGGSFALAIRKAGFTGKILGVSSPATIAEALALGVIDEGAELEAACSIADLVYLAQPISRIIEQLPLIGPHLKAGALVTDAGSTKVQIVEAARKCLPPGSFLGGHPMAGKESRGVATAEADLFRGRPYVLTPVELSDLQSPMAVQFGSWVEAFGARTVILSAEQHDSAVAFTSHVPQLISTALALTLAAVPQAREVAGPSVIDLTRVAQSPYEMWRDIFVSNNTNVSMALESFIDNVRILQRNLQGDLTQSFEQARDSARRIRENR